MNNLEVISNEIYATRDTFAAVLTDKSINFDAECGFALQLLQANEFALKIALQNRQSVINAVTNIAAIGISLNPAKKQAYLVPRKVGGNMTICLDLSYLGLLDLAVASGSIRWGQAETVHAADRFELNGLDKPPTHARDPFNPDRGEVVGYYVVVKTFDGDYLTTTMSIADVNKIRDRSESWKALVAKKVQSSPWLTDADEMGKKTVIKRASKLWPKTERLDQAIHHLDTDGGEGINFNAERGPVMADPEILARLLTQVKNAATTESLTGVWQAGLKEVQVTGDKALYASFKKAVADRGTVLKGEAVKTATPPDDGKTVDEETGNEGFGSDTGAPQGEEA